MFNTTVDWAESFEQELTKVASQSFESNLAENNNRLAIENLLKAAEILDQVGFEKEAQAVTELARTAWEVPSQPAMTSEQMMKNLMNHGTVLQLVPANFCPGAKAGSGAKSETGSEKSKDKDDDLEVSDKEMSDKEEPAEDRNEAQDGEILEVVDPDEVKKETKPETDEKKDAVSSNK